MVKIVLLSTACIAMLYLGGCSVQVRGKTRPLVRAERIHGELRLSMKENTSEWKSSGTKSKSDSSVSKQELYLHTQGDVFDSKLMTYMAAIGLGLNQQTFESSAGTDASSGNMNSYHLNMGFLPMKPYPFSIDLSKTESFSPRQFQSPLHVENTSTGILARLRVPGWPMTFAWNSNEIKQISDFQGTENLFTRTSERFSYSLLHDFNEQSHLDFRSDLDELSQKGIIGARVIKTARHRLLHDLTFGDTDQHLLNTSIALVDRTGDFESQTSHWNENLRLRHSKNLTTFYNISYLKNTFQASESQTTSGMAGFRHRLYNNFGTNFNVFTSKSDFGSDSESEWHGGELKFDYYRNNPWGRLVSDYSVRMTNAETTSATGTNSVNGEIRHFVDPFPVELEKRNIVVGTIVVRNSDYSEIYELGPDGDYTIDQVGDRVHINVIPRGSDPGNTLDGFIADGQDILVDYDYRLDASLQEDIVQQSFRIEQEFHNGISVFYSQKSRDSQVDSTLDTAPADQEFKTDTYGVEYKNDYVILGAEHLNTTSTNNSSESDRLMASAFWPVTSRTLLHGSISQTWIESSGDRSRETSLFKLKGGIKTRLSRYLKLAGGAELRNENNSDLGRTEGIKMDVALEYNRRSLSVKTGWESYFLERFNRETTTSMFYVRLIRRF